MNMYKSRLDVSMFLRLTVKEQVCSFSITGDTNIISVVYSFIHPQLISPITFKT